jgi:hypothetical protein
LAALNIIETLRTGQVIEGLTVGTMANMSTFVLADVSSDVWLESLTVDAPALGLGEDYPWSVRKHRLRGGRRDGVDLIVLDNGALRVSIVPTRGMGLWKGWYEGSPLGWESPITDGPVHPALVNLAAAGGLGWLEGFDELLARCGLENNGAPFEVMTTRADGSESRTTFGLHGKIANIPASYVAVHVGADSPHEITVEGHVQESGLFGPQIRMETRISTAPGSNILKVRDEFVNLKDQPVDMQILYHWNFGPPFLEAGARFAAPVRSLTPRDKRAQEGLARHDVFDGPRPGFTEQVYYFELHAGPGAERKTLSLLRNKAGDKAVVLRFRTDQLPAFTLWKNTAGLRDGYVTGLEPGTNYPNPRPFEQSRNRVATLPVDGRYTAEMMLEVLTTSEAVGAVETEIKRLQAQGAAKVNPRPMEPFAPEETA